ncbi:F0F1 ATP synthase subunit epsilon [Corynebacterium flavescens]|uniref:ATP synthase epsilon chain n=1 Tax=Corynebacterium flavescens TaxID=28028 RepID=A0A1L7CLA6_CORFL|nr:MULTISPECIES: F0F1 ATP synthase subunit epsilon [Corynebacterium]MDN6622666.1 F0F1 ATP synthase subunit epsilon [Bifidobacterium crudilactis]APT86630.1 ATP synthase F0F1 subunit epsilon [Corynebacterium flavescens]KAA8722795.1 F0F1 ATP synthase subunit epsilon [Corynebacterium flavescens]MDN6099501.1 F0F1 ATP synthase subunit epsilon [Corynebacterium flavescens]MDN6199176.1 F0F1 ATP synthase subunit epsilon [Corynebacterium flavescens]
MADITAELVAVERMLWSGQATMVTAETTEGEIGVLPGHEPVIGQLIDNGVVTIRPVDGDRLVAAVQGGFLSVSQKKITVLADWAIWSTEIDEARATEDLKSEDEVTRSRAEAALRALRRAQA